MCLVYLFWHSNQRPSVSISIILFLHTLTAQYNCTSNVTGNKPPSVNSYVYIDDSKPPSYIQTTTSKVNHLPPASQDIFRTDHNVPPETYMTFSIFNMLCCCLVLGFIALLHSTEVIILIEVLFRRSLVRKLTIDGNELRRLALR